MYFQLMQSKQLFYTFYHASKFQPFATFDFLMKNLREKIFEMKYQAPL